MINRRVNWKWLPGSFSLGKRLGAILLVAGCVGLIFWSVTIRLALVTQAQSQMHSPFSLTRELEKLRTSWSQERAETLKRDWEEFQRQNFHDYEHVVRWITKFSTWASSNGIEVSYRIADEKEPVKGLPSIKPISIEFSLKTEREEAAFARLVEFTKAVTESEVAVTLDKFDLAGSGRSVQKLELVVTAFMNART